jgi:Uncharacterized conserved protein
MFYSENLKKNNNIQHCFFSRKNGVSKGLYEGLNCGIGSNDQKKNVYKNLDIVSKKFSIKKNSLILMHQIHSNKVKIINRDNWTNKIECDAILTESNEIALAVLTADCVPILIHERVKGIVGCIHAGWKGSFNGIIENTLEKVKEMKGDIDQLFVSLVPVFLKKVMKFKKNFI